jgi:hypothetical protein
MDSVPPSVAGAAEVVAHLITLHATKQVEVKDIRSEWKLWPINDVPLSLDEAKKEGKALAEPFIDLVTEKSGGGTELARMLERITDTNTRSGFYCPAGRRRERKTSSPHPLRLG